jgi:hypothetical protein
MKKKKKKKKIKTEKEAASQGWGTSPRYSRTPLIAGALPVWFAGVIIVPGEPNRWCAGNNMGPAIRGT